MKIAYQTIKCDKNLPARIRMRDGPADSSSCEPHRHNEIQMIYVDDGKLQATIEYQDHEIAAGDIFLINSNTVHSLKGKNARYLNVHFSYVFVKSFFNYFENYDFVLEEGSQERREMVFLMQKLLAIEQNTFDEYSALKKYSLLLKMLRLLLTKCRRDKTFVLQNTRRSLESDAIAVKNYIEINFRRKILVSELAELIHYDPRAFTPYFKKLTGKRFTDYLQEVRTSHALEDYLAFDIPVGEAALKNGFCHYNFFSKACNKLYGASPTAIKKARKQKQGKAVSQPVGIPA